MARISAVKSLILAVLAFLCIGAAAPSDKLDAIKAKFPNHITGAVTDKSDPHVQVFYRKYKTMVDRITQATLPADIVRLRETMHNDLRDADIQLRDAHRVLDDQAKRAIRQNVSWLQQRVAPFVAELSRLQRGK